MLTARQAILIARQYGFDIKAGKWEKEFVLENLLFARQSEANSRNDGRKFKSAEAYFDGYMADTAAEFHIDGLAAIEFERNAY